jgi:hypothetical protein
MLPGCGPRVHPSLAVGVWFGFVLAKRGGRQDCHFGLVLIVGWGSGTVAILRVVQMAGQCCPQHRGHTAVHKQTSPQHLVCCCWPVLLGVKWRDYLGVSHRITYAVQPTLTSHHGMSVAAWMLRLLYCFTCQKCCLMMEGTARTTVPWPYSATAHMCWHLSGRGVGRLH